MASFRPLTGMVLYDYQIKGFFKEFSSPYGDGIYTPKVRDDIFVFSPPYGDGTFKVKEFACKDGFSLLYGENPLSHGLRRASSPERGSLMPGNGSCKSSPFGKAGAQRLRGFCGDKLKYHENRLLPVL